MLFVFKICLKLYVLLKSGLLFIIAQLLNLKYFLVLLMYTHSELKISCSNKIK